MFNLKFIGRAYLKIKKFFARPQWETIWSARCDGRYTINGVEVGKGIFLCVVKYDKYKKKYQSYLTDGTQNTDLDLAYLAGQSEKLRDILKNII